MKLNRDVYERVLAWASDETAAPPEHGDGSLMSAAIDGVASLWRDVETLVRSDDGFEPSANALARATAISRARVAPRRVDRGRLRETVVDLLARMDGFVASLVHDDRRSPLAVRGEAAQAVHMAWEAGDLDIDVVAEPSLVDPLGGAASRWVLRGEVMADVEVGGLEVSLIDPRTGVAVETAALDPFGRFVLEAEPGSWAMRIGLDSQGIHIEPVELA